MRLIDATVDIASGDQNHNHDLRENHHFVIFSRSCEERSEKVRKLLEKKSRNASKKSLSIKCK